MSALPRRVITLLLSVCLASLVLAGVAVASGQDVVADYDDNGVVDSCYSEADFRDALDIVRADQQQYGAAVEIIQEKQAVCAGETLAPGTQTEPAADDGDDDSGAALWVILAVVVVGAAGAAAFVAARRRRGGLDG